ncbi:hypothetical protein DIT68_06105 [Brumimicrobium oceani]|uniref:Deacylase n=2 Tax=Brumimicrobium oceani TaxID=2100725 RepID=A0A2U2XE90_9FLAO|nr:hypothetical protein DIT68_06105 [Brumimicrobium oceani]
MILCLGMLFPMEQLFAQTRNYGVSLSPQAGFLLPHRATMAHLTVGHSAGFRVGAVIQTNGEKQWHHDFNFPSIELGIFYHDLGNKDVLGSTFGFSAGIYLPYFKSNGWSFGNNVSYGLAWVSKKYDLVENPKNNAIGSNLNTITNVGFRLEKQFSKNSIALEVGMMHLSNGAYKLPNLGVNLPFFGFNFTHFIQPLKFNASATDNFIGLPINAWSFHTLLIGSIKQVYPTGGSTYGVGALTNYLQYSVKGKCIIEAGVDAIYNESIVKYNKGNHGRGKNFQIGLYGAYVLPIHKMQLVFAMGRYVLNPLDPAGQWYHKCGARFRLAERLWGNFTIKAHWAKADYFEYGLSYRWK